MSANLVTVRELIEKLSRLPPGALVAVVDWEENWRDEAFVDGPCNIFQLDAYEQRSGWRPALSESEKDVASLVYVLSANLSSHDEAVELYKDEVELK